MMKKLIALILSLVMLVSLAACATETAPSTEPSGEVSPTTSSDTSQDPAEKKSYKIAIVAKDQLSAWNVSQADGVVTFNKDTGLEAFQTGPEELDAALQVQVVDNLVAEGLDAICICAIDGATLESICAKAREAGIKVIVQEATSMTNIDYDLECFNPSDYGAAMMDTLAELMSEEGQYCTMVSYVTNEAHSSWADGAVARAKEAYPNITLIEDGRVESEDNVERAYEKAKEILKKYPDLKGFIGTSSNDLPGICRAIEELGLSGKVFATGLSMPSAVADYLENGTLQKAFVWEPAGITYSMLKTAYLALEGEEIAGADLGYKGYDNITVDSNNEKVLYGKAYFTYSKDTIDDLGFYL